MARQRLLGYTGTSLFLRKQGRMLGSIGMPELIIIFVIALIIFGPRKLPELGKSLGKSIAEFKKASNELRNTLEEEIRIEEQKEKDKEQRDREATPRTAEPSPIDPTASHVDEPVRKDHSA